MDHDWKQTIFKNGPSLTCKNCGFIWKPNMNQPKVTCEEIKSKIK